MKRFTRNANVNITCLLLTGEIYIIKTFSHILKVNVPLQEMQYLK